MKSGIYKITSPKGKIYIGSAVNLDKRLKQHEYKYRQWVKDKTSSACRYLYSAFEKYGFENFKIEVLENCEKLQLEEREQYWLDFYKSYNKENGYNILKKAYSNVGYKPSKESVEKMRKSLTGRKRSKESIKKQILSTKGVKRSESAKQNISKGRIEKLSQPVLQFSLNGDLIKEWSSLIEIKNELNYSSGNIIHAINGKYKHAYGYKWKRK